MIRYECGGDILSSSFDGIVYPCCRDGSPLPGDSERLAREYIDMYRSAYVMGLRGLRVGQVFVYEFPSSHLPRIALVVALKRRTKKRLLPVTLDVLNKMLPCLRDPIAYYGLKSIAVPDLGTFDGIPWSDITDLIERHLGTGTDDGFGRLNPDIVVFEPVV